MNFRYKLMQFMNGRYGLDNAFYVLFSVAAVCAIINSFVRSIILQFVVYAIVIYAFFRILSKNTAARSKENRIITGWVSQIRQKIQTQKNRRADTTHIYKRCPKCGVTLRLPRRKGKHKTVCPKCGSEFSVTVRK